MTSRSRGFETSVIELFIKRKVKSKIVTFLQNIQNNQNWLKLELDVTLSELEI